MNSDPRLYAGTGRLGLFCVERHSRALCEQVCGAHPRSGCPRIAQPRSQRSMRFSWRDYDPRNGGVFIALSPDGSVEYSPHTRAARRRPYGNWPSQTIGGAAGLNTTPTQASRGLCLVRLPSEVLRIVPTVGGRLPKVTGCCPYLSRLEYNHSTPSLETLHKLARGLEIPSFALFVDDGTCRGSRIGCHCGCAGSVWRRTLPGPCGLYGATAQSADIV